MEYLARLSNAWSVFTLNVQGVVFQNVFMHRTYLLIDERKIDRITSGREKINIGPKPLLRQCNLCFLENLTGKTGTPENFLASGLTYF